MAIRHNVPIKGVLTGVTVRPVPGSLRGCAVIAQNGDAYTSTPPPSEKLPVNPAAKITPNAVKLLQIKCIR
jgi:hypothetical protein